MSCFVPSCKNTLSMQFPSDANVGQQWIKNVKLSTSPTSSSSICLDYFKPPDLHDAFDLVESARACRICNTTECLEKSIYDPLEGKIPIMSIIMLCCHPVFITNTDNLPKFICSSCLKQLHESHKFRLKCLETDNIWNKKECHSNETNKRKVTAACDLSTKKVCTSETSQDERKLFYNAELQPMDISEALKYIKKEREEPDNDKQKAMISINAKHKNIHQLKNTEKNGAIKDSANYNTSEKGIEKSYITVHISKSIPPSLVPFDQPPPLVPMERKETASIMTAKKYEEIERGLEEIHGITGRNTNSVNNESETTKMKEDVKVKQVKMVPGQKTSQNLTLDRKAVNVINIPKGIRIVNSEVFESLKGKFSCVLIYGLQGSIFVLCKEYLFTFGLLKGVTRYLHCVLPSCKANAVQRVLEDGNYEDFIIVKIPHNHQPPSDQIRKKHMFFHVMRKRMQLDRTLNIRSIYEEVCNMDPEIRTLVPLRNVINEICRYQVSNRLPPVSSFEEFYEKIEHEAFEKLHFTNSNHQFYQEKFTVEDGSLAVVFCNTQIISQISSSKIMYVDASFKIDTFEDFKYQLITVLVWIDDSYYPILFALANKKTQEIFKKIFKHLHDVLAPTLRPHEIVTDYEANLYYALGETYLDSHIGGSVFYYTQNLYKKICSLNLSRDLEINSNFRNMYHMLLMLPLLPVNTIFDGLNNIEIQARDMGLLELAEPIFHHIRAQWIVNVTPELFCVHRLENRINENVIAPFKKLRDFLLLFKGKVNQAQITIAQVVEKLIDLESYMLGMYTKADKKSFGRDLSSFQKKNVIRAWQFIETHPKININNFFQKVLGYIKCMENQLWIWGFYRYMGDTDDVLISASNFSIIPGDSTDDSVSAVEVFADEDRSIRGSLLNTSINEHQDPTIVMEAVIDTDGGVVLETNEMDDQKRFEKAFLKYVQYQ